MPKVVDFVEVRCVCLQLIVLDLRRDEADIVATEVSVDAE